MQALFAVVARPDKVPALARNNAEDIVHLGERALVAGRL